jgi:hypothetical protein
MMKSNSEVMFIIFVSCLFAGVSLAAGPGFEPGLTDPESAPYRNRHRHGGTGSDKTAVLWEIWHTRANRDEQGATRGCGSVVVKGWTNFFLEVCEKVSAVGLQLDLLKIIVLNLVHSGRTPIP